MQRLPVIPDGRGARLRLRLRVGTEGGQTLQVDPLLYRRFGAHDFLLQSDGAAVMALCDPPVTIARRKTFVRSGEPATGMYLLLAGWVSSSIGLYDRGHQVVSVHLKGDLLGSAAMVHGHAVENLTAVTAVTVAFIPFARFHQLMAAQPAVAKSFYLSAEEDRVALMHRLVSIGRHNADARIAAFILDLFDRLSALRMCSGTTFEMLLTQSEIADATGLTAVHVNRMLQRLGQANVLKRSGRYWTVTDKNALVQMAR